MKSLTKYRNKGASLHIFSIQMDRALVLFFLVSATQVAILNSKALLEVEIETQIKKPPKFEAALTYKDKTAGKGDGQYDMVINFDDKNCNKKNYTYSSPIGAWEEDKVLVLRAPMKIASVRVYNGPTKKNEGWSLVSSYDAERAKAQNLLFFANRDISFDKKVSKSPLCFVKADGQTKSTTPEVFNGLLQDCKLDGGKCNGYDEMERSGAEIILQTSEKCDSKDSSGKGCKGYHGESAYRGWSGQRTIFYIRAAFIQSNYTNRPAIWMLNSQIVNAQQYLCNCRGMGEIGGCGELDIAEVIETDKEREYLSSENYCSDYKKLKCTNGFPNYAKRSFDMMNYVVIFDATKSLIKILVLGDHRGFTFSDDTLSDDFVTQLQELEIKH